MNPKPYKDFKLTRALARKIAIFLWGNVNCSIDTTRSGFFYFDCSINGGYIVDMNRLTEHEKELFDKIGWSENGNFGQRCELGLWVAHEQNGEDVIIHIDNYSGGLSKDFSYPSKYAIPRYIAYPAVAFGDDCAWIVIEKLTGVREKHIPLILKEKYESNINRKLKLYYPEIFELLKEP